jgi:hypothetical protein
MTVMLAMPALLWGAAAAIHKQGNLQVEKNCSVDLQAGDAACATAPDGEQGDATGHPKSKNEDFWFEKTKGGSYLSPLHNAMFAKGGLKEAGFEGCEVADFSKSRLRIDTLPQGTHFCVRTGKWHYAELRLSGFEADGDRALFTFITWEDRP